MVLQIEQHSSEVQNQLHNTIPECCLSNLLLEEKPRNREPMVFPGNLFSFFIVFLLSVWVFLLLLVKLICSELIPGGCREQCYFHAFGNIFEFDGRFEARLSSPLSGVIVSYCVKSRLKMLVCLVW